MPAKMRLIPVFLLVCATQLQKNIKDKVQYRSNHIKILHVILLLQFNF